MSDHYIYNDKGYKYSAIHRKVAVYDPRSSDNPIIHDYLNTIDSKSDPSVYYQLLTLERNRSYANKIELPIAFQSIFHDISMSWVNLIHEMVFRENSYATFIGEFKEIIENTILNDRLIDKDTLIYRYGTGETVFHIAAKTWLQSKYIERSEGSININLSGELKYILECYEELEWYFGEDRKYCILYLMDFKNKTLIDMLHEYVYELEANSGDV